jgi:23S rRNA (pseudouridine1915-N3)-methyltransferase
MKVTIVAVGRLKAGPERELANRYLERAKAAGKRLQFDFAVREVPESQAGSATVRKDQEAAGILGPAPTKSILVTLDQAGQSVDSKRLAAMLADWRDDGAMEVLFAIGGADGLARQVLDAARLRLSFGAMTWPHQMARIMMAEQCYRAVTILSGHPYHRE